MARATLLACLVTLAVPQAYAAKRVALVIGNAAYAYAPTLRNPTNDARAIAALLKHIGFDEVDVKLDLGFDGMRLALRDFGLRTRGADVALVYFAGHGLELGGENFLVPVDAALKSASSIAFEAATLSAVLDAVRPAAKLRFVILDACRNNPLAARMELAGGLTRSVPRGLGRIEPTGDVLVAYAAKAGTVAEDGPGTNSPFAEALLAHLATPDLDIRLVMGRVRDAVLEKTARAQEPFMYGSLGGQAILLMDHKRVAEIEVQTRAAEQRRIAELRRAEEARIKADEKARTELEAAVKETREAPDIGAIEAKTTGQGQQLAVLPKLDVARPQSINDGIWRVDQVFTGGNCLAPIGSKYFFDVAVSGETVSGETAFGTGKGRLSASGGFSYEKPGTIKGNLFVFSGRYLNGVITGTFSIKGHSCGGRFIMTKVQK